MLDPIDINEVDLELHPGETLLLYTDGLPEAGRTGRSWTRAAVRGLRRGRSRSSAALLGRIERAALSAAGGRLRDDIALLALRVVPQPAGA